MAGTNFQSAYNVIVFDRYTEKAKRAIFFARYEASQFGSPYIETEHLLLGLLREDKALTNRFLRSHSSVESIRKQIEGHTTIREKVSTSVDLPLSNECKRVLAYAAEEAERLSHKHIGTEHLLLGLLREEKCFAAEILHERGLQVSTIREELGSSVPVEPEPQQRWVQDVARDYLMGGAVQLAFFVLVILGLAKSAISERHLFVIAAVWFAAALVWLRVGPRFSFLWKGSERRLVITATAFGLFYHLFMIGWVIPLTIALLRALER